MPDREPRRRPHSQIPRAGASGVHAPDGRALDATRRTEEAMRARIQSELAAQQEAMQRTQAALNRTADQLATVGRQLDESDLQLQSAAKRLTLAADLVTQVEAEGPDAALQTAIERLRQELMDRSAGRYSAQYADLLERALEVQAANRRP